MAGGYAAVFDNAIRPYLVDESSSSTTVVAAQPVPEIGAPVPVTTTITVLANPPVQGVVGAQTYGLAFQQGSRVVVDVGPNQETDVIIQSLSGLVLTVALALAHGPVSYPVTLQGSESFIRLILRQLDAIRAQLIGIAPIAAGVQQADEVKLYASQRGRRGQKSKYDELIYQRDETRKELAALLGIPNLWELQGKLGGPGAGGASQQFEPY